MNEIVKKFLCGLLVLLIFVLVCLECMRELQVPVPIRETFHKIFVNITQQNVGTTNLLLNTKNNSEEQQSIFIISPASFSGLAYICDVFLYCVLLLLYIFYTFNNSSTSKNIRKLMTVKLNHSKVSYNKFSN